MSEFFIKFFGGKTAKEYSELERKYKKERVRGSVCQAQLNIFVGDVLLNAINAQLMDGPDKAFALYLSNNAKEITSKPEVLRKYISEEGGSYSFKEDNKHLWYLQMVKILLLRNVPDSIDPSAGNA